MATERFVRRGRVGRARLRSAGAPAGPRRADMWRATLIAAAGALFVERGVEATTVDEIAVYAGVAKGTFYHYFETKADLIPALRERFSDAFMGRVTQAVDACDADDWQGRLRAWIEAAVIAYFDMSGLHDVVFHGAEMPLRQAMGDIAVVQDLAGLLADGAEAGAWTVEDAREAAIVMFHGLHGATDEAIVTGRTVDEIAALLSTLYLRMIGVAA
ncbi:TetR/AcrR family transcriptional regulator [Sphingomonas sp. ERG5]|uniref:TetR/AcrR family transcriptional regulator n=1 Tax=Sphingomonas sp. ERG5 TaxID=1381597 RepID=UPI00068A0B20|nr:TetR/AcrR family transcriptional regulator [Sphingomonas sp. ERG5]